VYKQSDKPAKRRRAMKSLGKEVGSLGEIRTQTNAGVVQVAKPCKIGGANGGTTEKLRAKAVWGWHRKKIGNHYAR